MTAADLRAWIKSRGLTRAEAAELLALTPNQLNKRLDGSNQVGAQTARIVELLERNEELAKMFAAFRANLRWQAYVKPPFSVGKPEQTA